MKRPGMWHALFAGILLTATAAHAKVSRMDACAAPLRIELKSPRPEARMFTAVSCAVGVLEHANAAEGEPPSAVPPVELIANRRKAGIILTATRAVGETTLRLPEARFEPAAGAQAWTPSSGGASWQVTLAPVNEDLVSIEVEDEPIAAVARRLADVESLRVEHADRLPEVPVTLRFAAVAPAVVLGILAEVGDTLLLRGDPGHFGFMVPAQATAVRQKIDVAVAAMGGRDDKALERALRALLAAAPSEGDLVLDLVEPQLELSRILRTREDLAGAEHWQRAAVSAIRRFDGPALSPRAVVALTRLAGLREDRGDHAGAVQLWREAVEVGERVLAPDDASLQPALAALAYDAAEKDQPTEAGSLFARATARVMGAPPGSLDALRSAHMLAAYALWLEQQGRGHEATPLLERQHEIMVTHYGANDAMTRMAVAQLAQHWLEQDELARARPLIAQVLSRDSDTSARWIQQAPQVLAAIEALGPFARRDAEAPDLPALRASLESVAPEPETAFEMMRLLEARAERLAGDAGLSRHRRTTCAALGEVEGFLAQSRGARAAVVQAAREAGQMRCLARVPGTPEH